MMASKITRFTVFWKISLPVFFALALIIAFIYFLILPQLEKYLLDERYKSVKSLVQTASTQIDSLELAETLGKITHQQLLDNVRQIINTSRFDDTNYFFIFNKDTMVFHGVSSAKLVGKPISYFKDADSSMFLKKIYDNLQEKNECYVAYHWAKPNSAGIYPKQAYARKLDKYGWIIAAGVYIDDVQAQISMLKANIIYPIAGFSIILLVFIALISIKWLVNPIKNLQKISTNISSGDLSLYIKHKSKDEIGDLFSAFGDMSDTIKSLVNEINSITNASMLGKLDYRGNPNKFSGVYSDLVDGMNNTLDAIISPLNVAAEYVDRISKGDIPPHITDNFKGDFNEIKNNLNQCIDSVNLLVNDSLALAESTSLGKLDRRANESNHHGDFKKIVNGFNITLDNVIGPLNVAAEYVDRIAKGNIPTKIIDVYKGDFNEIKNNMNNMIDNLNTFIKETDKVVQSAIVGELNVRGDESKLQGDWGKMLSSVNKLIETVEAPINDVKIVVKNISVNDYSVKLEKEYLGIWNDLKTAINDTMERLVHIQRGVVAISKGDLTEIIELKKVGKRSENDKLIPAFTEMIEAIQNIIIDLEVLTNDINAGKLKARADTKKHSGVFRDIVQGINHAMDNIIGPLIFAADYVDCISKGDMPPLITDEYKGDFNVIKNNLNQCINAINLLIADTLSLVAAAAQGNLSTRANSANHQGDFKKIIEGFNLTLDNVINPINITVEYFGRIASGFLPELITTEFKGDFNVVKESLNEVINTLHRLGDETVFLIKSIKLGDLTAKAKTEQFTGQWAELVEGINGMLDAVAVPVNETKTILENIAVNDYTQKMKSDYRGVWNDLKIATNNSMERLEHLQNVLVDISKGDLKQLDELSIIGRRSENDKLLPSLIQVMESIARLIIDGNELTQSAIVGKLDVRGEISNHSGGYQEIIKGFNDTLDIISNIIDSTTNLMIADSKGTINYINKPLMQFFTKYENDFKKQILGFSLDTIKGSSVSEFRGSTSSFESEIKKSTGSHTIVLNVADKIFRITINPLNDIHGRRRGYTLQWENSTNELNFENALKGIIDKMLVGNLDTLIDTSNLEGEYKETAIKINDMLFSIIDPLKAAARYFNRISKGDIPALITEDYQGDFNAIKINLNTCINAINELIKDTAFLAEAAIEGKLGTRVDATKHFGDFRKIVEGINKTLDSVINPINETVNVLQEWSNGNLSLKVLGDYKGDHAILKNAINKTVDYMPFKETISVMQALADGDLTKSITGNYNGDSLMLKNAINETIESISEILSQVATTVEEVTRGAMQVSDASTALSQGATEQAASLEEITSSMSEIGSQTKLNAENADQAKSLTLDAREAAEKGNNQMNQFNSAMTEISDSSKNISKIIKVIDEIAFQTNLLALNAAVEAARAGRHGKGFAVVAEEVRNLAARSATAAKETSELIENSIKTVEKGSNLAAKTSEALFVIRNGSIITADIVSEIAVASNEQAQGIAQINEGLTQIDKVTQTNTASAEESASAAEQLSGQAAQLRKLIARFKLRKEFTYNKMYNDDEDVFPSHMISTQRNNRKGLPKPPQQFDEEFNPEDIIKLDEDDFGKY